MKRRILSILLCLTLLVPVISVSGITADAAAKKGDLDGDGAITVNDALCALRIAVRLEPETEANLAVGNVDNDGHITVSDALAILRVSAKLATFDTGSGGSGGGIHQGEIGIEDNPFDD